MEYVQATGSSISALPKNAPAAASRVLRGPAASRRASSGRQIAMYRR